MGRSIFVQRISPLATEYKRRFPRMRKIVFKPCGKIEIEGDRMLEQELLEKIYTLFGSGDYQLLGYRKTGFKFAFHNENTNTFNKPFKKFRPFYVIGQISVDKEGKGNKIIINKRFRYILMKEKMRAF